MRTQQNVIKYFTDKEIRKIFSTIEKTKNLWNPYYLRDLCVFHILYYCGLRASEIWLLRLWNYNPQTGELFVIRKKWSINQYFNQIEVEVGTLCLDTFQHPRYWHHVNIPKHSCIILRACCGVSKSRKYKEMIVWKNLRKVNGYLSN